MNLPVWSTSALPERRRSLQVRGARRFPQRQMQPTHGDSLDRGLEGALKPRDRLALPGSCQKMTLTGPLPIAGTRRD